MMTENATTDSGPLWLSIEGKILDLSNSDFAADVREATVRRIAEDLGNSGVNVSRHAGNMLQLRSAIDARAEVGRPFLKDFNDATSALTLDDVIDAKAATVTLVRKLGEAWPLFKDLDRRPDILEIVEGTKLDLLVAKGVELPDDKGVRYLIEQGVVHATIIERLGVTADAIAEVEAAIATELAAIARVTELLADVEGKPDDDRARHLIENDVPEGSIVELAGIGQAVIDGVKEKMTEELAEKKRQEEKAAAKKKAEAEGPSLDDIPADKMLEHIEAIREIMEFSDQPDEIRTMCEQSNIPKSLVEIAVSDADRLDELEKATQG
jgi:hypothetical protein